MSFQRFRVNGYAVRGKFLLLTLLHSEWPNLYGVLAVLSAIGLKVDLFLERFYCPSGKQTRSQIFLPVEKQNIKRKMENLVVYPLSFATNQLGITLKVHVSLLM